MDRIVVPLDGSELSERALRPAYATARRGGASVILVSAIGRSAADGRLRYLEDRAALVDLPVEVMTYDGEVADAVSAALSGAREPLVFMASHGRSGLRNLAGGTAESVLAQVPCPIAIVGPRCHAVLIEGERGKILVGVSDEPESESVIAPAARLAHSLGMEAHLVEVVGPEELVENGQPDRHVASAAGARVDTPTEMARSRLADLARRFPASGAAEPSTEVLYGAEIVSSVTRHAARTMASFLAMATHCRGGLDRVTKGSVVMEAVAVAPCPVLTVTARS
jgi:nucleotide-binding universal stress UspA family protein